MNPPTRATPPLPARAGRLTEVGMPLKEIVDRLHRWCDDSQRVRPDLMDLPRGRHPRRRTHRQPALAPGAVSCSATWTPLPPARANGTSLRPPTDPASGAPRQYDAFADAYGYDLAPGLPDPLRHSRAQHVTSVLADTRPTRVAHQLANATHMEGDDEGSGTARSQRNRRPLTRGLRTGGNGRSPPCVPSAGCQRAFGQAWHRKGTIPLETRPPPSVTLRRTPNTRGEERP